MEIRYIPTEEDVVSALRAVPSQRWNMFLFVLLLALMSFVGIYLIDKDYALAGWIWLAVTAVIGFVSFEIARVQAVRDFRRNPSAGGEVVHLLTEEGISTTFATGKVQVRWQAYTKYEETKDLFLLYRSPLQPMPIPKRAMSAAEIDRLRAILKERFGAH